VRTLVAMGIAGGLVPSPSALFFLLAANGAGYAWFGVVLVVAYGVGMALTLTVAGLVLLRARRYLERAAKNAGRRSAGSSWQSMVRGAYLGRLLVALPVLTAAVIVVVGGLLALRGVLVVASLG